MKNFVFSDGILWIEDTSGGMPVMMKGSTCPYCDAVHVHGIPDGHRVAHCTGKARAIKSPWGKYFDKSDGYYWITEDIRDYASLFKKVCDGITLVKG